MCFGEACWKIVDLFGCSESDWDGAAHENLRCAIPKVAIPDRPGKGNDDFWDLWHLLPLSGYSGAGEVEWSRRGKGLVECGK